MVPNSEEAILKSDEEIVTLVLNVSREYFCLIIERYQAKLLRYLKRLTNISEEDAEDLLQETFIKVFLHLNDFDASKKFSCWIYRIAHNQAISNFRKVTSKAKDKVIKVDEQIINNIASDFNLLEEVDKKFSADYFSKIVNCLDENYREAIILKYFEDKDYKEISYIMHKPIGTVGTLINRAKKQLRSELSNKIILNI